MNEHVLLYDYKRDEDLKLGQAILVFSNGKTKRVRESSLYPKEEVSVREPVNPKKTRVIRSRSARGTQRRNRNVKQSPSRKRTAVYQA